MGDACKDWSKWAEDIYWTHFQTFHFYQFLRSGFDRRLVSLGTIFFLLGSIEFHVYEKFENTKRW